MPSPSFAETTLIWNGADGATWEGENWLEADGITPSAWVAGASAVFPSAATVALSSAVSVSNLTISAALTVTGAVSTVYSGFLNGSSAVLVFPGLTMDDIDGLAIAADLNGLHMGAGIYNYSKVYFWRRSGTTAMAQFQCIYNNHLRCVKVTFTEGADGIYAQASKNSYLVRSSYSPTIGRDIDVLSHVETTALSTTADVSGIGVCNIRLYQAETTLAGVASTGGTLTFDKAVLRVTAPVAQTIGSKIVCTEGSVIVQGKSEASDITYGNTGSDSGTASLYLTTSASDTVLTNMVLSMIEPVSAVMAGSSIGGTHDAAPYLVKSDGKTMTLQFQFSATSGNKPYIKGVTVELTQEGSNVTARAIKSYYHVGGTLGEDMTTTSGVTAYTVTQNGVKNMTLKYATPPQVAFNSQNEISNMIVDGASVNFSASGSQPRNSLVARNAAYVEYPQPESSLHADAVRIFESGSVMSVTYNMGTPQNTKYVFDAATLHLPIKHVNVLDGRNYFDDLTLRNGAQMTGYPLRCGNRTAECTYTSEGETGCTIASGIDLVKVNQASGTNDLAFVTTTDLLVSGNIFDWPSGGNYVGMRVFKRGAAMLTLSGNNTFVGRLTVEAGTLALGSNTALPSSAPLTLAGGTVACGATANSTGALTLSGNAAISLGESGSLAFADSSGASWTSGAMLNITGPGETPPDGAIRFGTNGNGLTSAQLRQIRYNGNRVSLTPEGYLGGPKGLIVTFR